MIDDPTFACHPRQCSDGTRDIYLRLRGGEMHLTLDDAAAISLALTRARWRAQDPEPLPIPKIQSVSPRTQRPDTSILEF